MGSGAPTTDSAQGSLGKIFIRGGLAPPGEESANPQEALKLGRAEERHSIIILKAEEPGSPAACQQGVVHSIKVIVLLPALTFHPCLSPSHLSAVSITYFFYLAVFGSQLREGRRWRSERESRERGAKERDEAERERREGEGGKLHTPLAIIVQRATLAFLIKGGPGKIR